MGRADGLSAADLPHNETQIDTGTPQHPHNALADPREEGSRPGKVTNRSACITSIIVQGLLPAW